MTWNKIKSYSELNKKVDKHIGTIVLTGVFQIPRKEVAEYAVKLGFKVHANVSKNTDYVITGSENVGPNKIADVLKLKEKGHHIRVIDENEFLSLLSEYMD